jgi:radical SAM superfamily enzyme YgiQ (UPF0313 family)
MKPFERLGKPGPKRILLISPCSEKEMADRYFMSPPLGVIRLAGFLAARGHHAEYFDPNVHVVTGKGLSVFEKIAEKDWDIIGFSSLDETLVTDMQNMHHAHKANPSALIIAGGIEAQFNYQTILDKAPCSVVIIGEGEIPMLSLANGEPPHQIPGIVIKNAAAPLSQELFNEATTAIEWENLPYEVYWDHYVTRYGDSITELNMQEIHTVRVFSRNRCPVGCKFCSSTNQLTWGSDGAVPVISTTEENLVSVIKRIRESHPRVKTIYLTDDDFCINKRSVERFCDQVIAEDFGELSFMCFGRATDLHPDILRKMKAANFRRIIIGVESFSQAVLDDMNKRCDVGEVHQVLKTCREIGLKPHINIILVTAETKLWDIEQSVEWAMYYLLNEYVHAAIIPAIRPLKGTDYFEEYSDYKTKMVPIAGTRYMVKVDEMIWAKDPIVRDLQARYCSGLKDEIELQVKANGIAHPTGNTLAMFSLMYMKMLLADVKREYEINDSPTFPFDNKYRLSAAAEFDNYLEKRKTMLETSVKLKDVDFSRRVGNV